LEFCICIITGYNFSSNDAREYPNCVFFWFHSTSPSISICLSSFKSDYLKYTLRSEQSELDISNLVQLNLKLIHAWYDTLFSTSKHIKPNWFGSQQLEWNDPYHHYLLKLCQCSILLEKSLIFHLSHNLKNSSPT
jgi:hypothetical protein